MSSLEACVAYLGKLPPANSGSGGHNATLQAALACKRFGLSRAEMWEAMTWFNDHRCTPRWSERDLRHKIDSVADLPVKKPLGRPVRHNRSVGFTPPARPVRKPDGRPVIERTPQEEELWWEQVAAVRGLTLQELDYGDLLQTPGADAPGQDANC